VLQGGRAAALARKIGRGGILKNKIAHAGVS